MKRRGPIGWMVVAFVTALGTASAIAAQDDGPYVWSDPQPPITSITELAEKTVDSKVGLVLEPPAATLIPVVSAKEAVAKAWAEEGAPGNPTGVHATFASLTWGAGQKDTPVWVMTYEGAGCIPAAGAPGMPPACENQAFHTLIDANTGEYIASFTSPDPDSEGL